MVAAVLEDAVVVKNSYQYNLIMISNYDKKFNKVSNLHRSKWTSLKKLNGWKHYEVVNIDKKNDFIELFAICDRSKKTIVNKKNLKNINLWKRGWK